MLHHHQLSLPSPSLSTLDHLPKAEPSKQWGALGEESLLGSGISPSPVFSWGLLGDQPSCSSSCSGRQTIPAESQRLVSEGTTCTLADRPRDLRPAAEREEVDRACDGLAPAIWEALAGETRQSEG